MEPAPNALGPTMLPRESNSMAPYMLVYKRDNPEAFVALRCPRD